jgi:hypothetical protein
VRDFYERNSHIQRPIPNAKSPSELLDGRSREVILRNTFLYMKDVRKFRGMDLWSWVGAMTGHGSGYSMQICEELGWDPHMRISPSARLPDLRPALETNSGEVKS